MLLMERQLLDVLVPFGFYVSLAQFPQALRKLIRNKHTPDSKNRQACFHEYK